MTLLDLVLGVLCAYRLTQLLVWDTLLEPVTRWLASRSRWLDELLACPHCTGFWCSVCTVGLLALSKDTTWVACRGCALAFRWILWAFALAGTVSIMEHATCWLGPDRNWRITADTTDNNDNKERQ